jgi:non-ribosomal peptide synthetase component F
VVIGTPVANRTRAEVEPLIGFFVNTLALRLDLSKSPKVSELLRRVKAQTLGAQEHQDIPFEQVVEIVGPPRSLAHGPLVQVMFGWQNSEAGAFEAPGLTLAPVGLPYVSAKHDLSLYLNEVGDRIVGGLEYATALFDGSTIERHCGYLRNALLAMVADDEQAIDRLPLLSRLERQQALVEWNATQAEYPQDQCIHELFEAQAGLRPDAIAVVQKDDQLSYGELNRRANQLARHLLGMGVGPEVCVGLYLERSAEMLVGILAVL